VEYWAASPRQALTALYALLDGPLPCTGGNTPPPDSIEGILSTLPWDRSLIDTRRLAEAITKPAPRISHDFAYFPLDPAQLDTIDGVAFLKHAVRLGSLG
jgi:hypothetical protein